MLEWLHLMTAANPILRALRAVTGCTLLAAGTSGLAAQCVQQQLPDIPVTMLGNEPLIDASINGSPVKMLFDTGATKSMIWRASAKALKLSVVEGNLRLYGVDGREVTGLTKIRDFGLAGRVDHNLSMLAAGSGAAPNGSVGLLGEDGISSWDLDIDFSAGKLRLFRPKDCKAEQVIGFWGSTNYSMLPLVAPPPGSDLLWAHVQIDGRQVLAMFDTGASRTVVTTLALRRLGIKPETQIEANGVSHGIANQALKTTRATFATLSVGQETVQNVRLRIADLFSRNSELDTGSMIPQNAVDSPDMLIGADFFLAHHVYIARSQGKIYFSYKGGPIFQRDEPKPQTATTDSDSDGNGGSAPSPDSDAPTTKQ
jgi:predicted aspartyl protease